MPRGPLENFLLGSREVLWEVVGNELAGGSVSEEVS